jgi:hypothetical protein
VAGWAYGAEHHSFTGVRMGAPLAFSSTTTNLAGFVLLALGAPALRLSDLFRGGIP